MPSDHWTRVDAILSRALTLPNSERGAFVLDACGADDSLRKEVEALIQAAEEADARFGEDWGVGNHFPGENLLDVLDPPLEPDQTVGPYRLIRRIGRGGMGSVYLAERADDQFQRQVALKVVGATAPDEAAVSRFLRERQILARLQHPGIARLYTGGFTEDGRPYFAMEYVDGVPITEFCDGQSLSISDRLDLFQDVAEAVQYAHRNLVIHRDLKPSNILVTPAGEVKLLDFGIAKLLEEDPAHAVTRTGAGLLTPGYASPEQVLGATITTGSDVYQLGVLLYELLAGQSPHAWHGRTPFEAQRAIVEEDPVLPSKAVDDAEDASEIAKVRGVTPQGLCRSLRGDLDTIVLKALSKEPERRYGSVIELAADTDRHRKGLPVSARPATLGYRFLSFSRRHRVGVAVAALFVAFLSTYAVTVTSQAREIQRERNRAEQERDRALQERAAAEQVTATFAQLFESADPYSEGLEGGEDIRVGDFLERGAQRVRDDLSDQPKVQAQLLNVLGTVQLNLGRYSEAEPLFREELAVRRRMGDEGSPELGQALADLAHLLQETGAVEDSERLFRQALGVQRDTLDANDPALAVTLTRLGGLLWFNKGDHDGAEEAFREALRIRRASLDRSDPDLTSSLNSMANLLQNKGDLEGADPYYREAIELYREQLGEHPNVAIVQANFAGLLRDEGKYREAEEVMRAALATHRKLQGEKNIDVALGLGTLGSILLEQDRLQEADSLFREALPQQLEFFGEEHPYVLRTRLFMARLLFEKGDLDPARTRTAELVRAHQRALPEGHFARAYPTVLLARIQLALGRPEVADSLLQEALAIREEAYPSTHWQLAEARGLLGAALREQGQFQEAETLIKAAVSVLEAQRGLADPYTKEAILALASLYEDWDRPELARKERARLSLSGEAGE